MVVLDSCIGENGHTLLCMTVLVAKNAGQEYRTIGIEKGALNATVSSSGTLISLVQVQVGSQVSGQLKEILVDFNSEVKQGQLIAGIDPETFEYKVSQVQADVDAARSKCSDAASQYQCAARRSIVRRDRSERTAVRPPLNGIVIKRSVEKEQTVAASLQAPELFIIAGNLTNMQVDASIDESDIGRIRNGQKARSTVDAFSGRIFDGRSKQIGNVAQNGSNVVAYIVKVSAANPKGELLPGMTANVRILTDNRSGVLKAANAVLHSKLLAAKADRLVSVARPTATGSTGADGGQQRAMRERREKELQLSADQKITLDAMFAAVREKFIASRDAP
jgi:HlyD family secretion protein